MQIDMLTDVPQILYGVAHELMNKLHRAGFAHLDLKPANICVSSGHVVRIIDFVLSTQARSCIRRIQRVPPGMRLPREETT